ncbi:alpha/beta fold hydrolase [Deinococcus cellulosilyticus]|nr:alpha/beta hydrolase [Deinococcus cellulosilyticus]
MPSQLNEFFTPAGIHVLSTPSSDLIPVVFLGGICWTAETARNELLRYRPHQAIAFSYRGHGQSAFREGLGIHELKKDLLEVVETMALQKFCLVAYSFSVPVAILFSRAHSDLLKMLVLMDYPAESRERPLSWVSEVQAALPTMDIRTIEGLQQDITQQEFWKDLQGLPFPVLLLHGTQEDSRIAPVHLQKYHQHVDRLLVEKMEGSGHNLWQPDPEAPSRKVLQHLHNIMRPEQSGEFSVPFPDDA